MDLALTDFSFKQAADGLRRFRRPTLNEVFSRLSGLHTALTLAPILHGLDPVAFRESCQGRVLAPLSNYDQSFETAISARLQQIAPFDGEFMELNGDGVEEGGWLVPECAGYPCGWDEWEEMTSNPAAYDTPYMQLYIFCTALRLGESQLFDNASEAFGWDIAYPDKATNFDPDWERLYRLLRRRGLGPFCDVWDVCTYSTGNIYFDFNAYDEDVDWASLPFFDLDGFRQLAKEWQAAQPILEQFRIAVHMAEQDSRIFAELLRAYCDSFKPERRRKSKTLAEIWNEESEGGIDRDTVVHDDYGNPHQVINEPFFNLPGEGDEDEDDESIDSL